MGDTLKCPYCGSEDYDIYDNDTLESKNIDYCVCMECDKMFDAIYTFSHIEKREG